MAFPFVKMKKLAWCGSHGAPHSENIHVVKNTVTKLDCILEIVYFSGFVESK